MKERNKRKKWDGNKKKIEWFIYIKIKKKVKKKNLSELFTIINDVIFIKKIKFSLLEVFTSNSNFSRPHQLVYFGTN